MSRFHAKLNRRKWEAARLVVLDRDGWRCRSCGKAGKLCVDHIEPLERGGDPFDPMNLQALCGECHRLKSRGEQERPDPARDRWRAVVQARLIPSPSEGMP